MEGVGIVRVARAGLVSSGEHRYPCKHHSAAVNS